MAGTKTSSPSRKDLLASIDIPTFLAAIADPAAHGSAVLLLNIFEQVLTEFQALTEEVQLLRDEVNRLKGEQGKPTLKPKKADAKISIVQPSGSDSTESGTNHSSGSEHQTPK